MLALLVVVVFLDQLARAKHLYWSFYEFDSLVHFLAGAAVALFFSWLYFFSGIFNPPRRNLARFLLIAFLGTMFVGFCWEIYELVFGQTMVQEADYSQDLFLDIVMDLFGVLAGCFYGYLKEEKFKMQGLKPLVPEIPTNNG